MITVRVDSRELPADFGQLNTMADLVELIKATIDPDCIITTLLLAGRPLQDTDWQSPLNVFGDTVLEVTTGEKSLYVRSRLLSADSYLVQITAAFDTACQHYRGNNPEEANKNLAAAVDDLLAFLNWYVALLALEQQQRLGQISDFQARTKRIQEICEQLIQQQLYNSWWSLAETLQTRLIPELQAFRGFCQQVALSSPAGLPS